MILFQPNDLKNIDIVATASGTSPDNIVALRALTKLPIDMAFDNVIPYHANTDEKRYAQFVAAVFNTSSDIIWALRGGYGSARLLDKLRELPVPVHQKLFIGFSDNTALHLFLSEQWGWHTLHAMGFAQLLDKTQDPENYKRIIDIIKNDNIKPISIKPMNVIAQQSNIIEGPLTGGNLTVLESGIGTHWQANTAGKIVFLEDVGEKGYRIDRSLYHVYQAGLFHEVKAVILGEFLSQEDPTMPIALQRFAEHMVQHHIPVYQTNQLGHGKMNYPVCYQAASTICTASQQLTQVFKRSFHQI